MPAIISTDLPLCIGCYKCVRVCPVTTANVTYIDGEDNTKVRIDQTRCVSCGACLEVCPRGARHYQDDSSLLFKRLAAGDAISAIVSPTIKGNSRDFKSFIHLLKTLGMRNVFSLSLGLEIYVWATLRHLEGRDHGSMIASYCPVLVSFCENHRPELIPRLSPIMTPASILSMVLKRQAGVADDLVIISPCLAELGDHASRENLKYCLSFSRLREHMVKTFRSDEWAGEADFDPIPINLETTNSFSGTFIENMQYFKGPDFRCDRFHGTEGLKILDEYSASDPARLPRILDLALCEGGCPMGPGRIHEVGHMGVNAHLHEERRKILRERDRGEFDKRLRFFDETLDLEDFLRDYHASAVIQDFLPEDRVNDAFLSLNKTTSAQKTIDCYACGAKSCLEMARMVALGVNLPTNCVTLSKELIAQAGKKMSDYLQLVRLIGEYMLASGLSDIGSSIEHSLMALCSSLDISRASIWRNSYNASEIPGCTLFLSFPARLQFHESSFTSEQLPGWMEALTDGEVIVKSFAELNARERLFFSGRDLGVLAMVPIMAQGEFWGMVMIARRHDHPFTREEISVIESSSFLIISSLISSTSLEADSPGFPPILGLNLEPPA